MPPRRPNAADTPLLRAARARGNAASMALIRDHANAVRRRARARAALARRLPLIPEAPRVNRRNAPNVRRRPMASYGARVNPGWERTWRW